MNGLWEGMFALADAMRAAPTARTMTMTPEMRDRLMADVAPEWAGIAGAMGLPTLGVEIRVNPYMPPWHIAVEKTDGSFEVLDLTPAPHPVQRWRKVQPLPPRSRWSAALLHLKLGAAYHEMCARRRRGKRKRPTRLAG